MELTADRLIVISRGRLLADTTASELAARSGGSLENAFLALTGGSSS
jgi:ABC-2 type transport system ATP-binding protein